MKLFYFISFFLFINFACKQKEIPSEGYITVEGGKIWYKIVGAGKKNTPLVLVHGGPGASSFYLQPLEKIAEDRPVIFYDQLGGGRSEQPDDTSLWTMPRFAKELTTLREQLNLPGIHLFAHSMGAAVALEYMATDPKGVKSVILASPVISVKKHIGELAKLTLQQPAGIRDTLLFYNENKALPKTTGYQQAYDAFLRACYCRVNPHPKEMQESEKSYGAQVYAVMWGGDEFECTGNLREFDRTDVLKKLQPPALFTCGRYDFCTPEIVSFFAKQVKDVEFVVFEKSAHMTVNEEPEAYNQVLSEFLRKHD